MDRVLIIGCSAAGKSTVARELGKILGIEVIHLDKLLWKPGCNLAEESEERRVVRELLDRPRWIMDGNYTASLPMRLTAADTIVLIDYPRPLCLLLALKRLLTYRGRTRPDMGTACPEQLNLSFLRWIWDYPKQERPELLKHLSLHGKHARLVSLRSPGESRQWLAQVRRQAPILQPNSRPPTGGAKDRGSQKRSHEDGADRTNRRSLAPASRN